MKKGLLLINLGTPANCDTVSVRRFLRSFLADKFVIDLPFPFRYFLLYAFILPFRPKASAKAYQAIWQPEGSPLWIESKRLQCKLQDYLGENWIVSLGMRYGEPSLEKALATLNQCSEITILPLYPQYSYSASRSALDSALKLILQQPVIPKLRVIRDFYNLPAFIQSTAELIKPLMQDHEYLLLSYHGVPERQLRYNGCQQACQTSCPPVTSQNHSCYRAQCFATSLELAKQLQLQPRQFGTAFQSRLGKASWIKPYTDEVLIELAKQGVKRLLIACPSFVTDCLETLEEIGIRAKAQWHQLGGEVLNLVPCVNDNEPWVQDLVGFIENANE